MRKLSIALILLIVCGVLNGQVKSVTLNQKDTSICVGTSIRISPSFFIGSFKYIGTYGSNDYFVDTISRSWSEGRAAAITNKMDLWVVDDESENNSVYNMLPNRAQTNTLFWIGLYQDANIENQKKSPDSGWHWIDGRSLDTTFSFWDSGQPDDAFGFSISANYASIGLNTSTNHWSDMIDVLPTNYSGYAIAERPHASMSFLWSNGNSNWYIDVSPIATSSYYVDLTYDNILYRSPSTKITVNTPSVSADFSQDPSSYYCLKKNNIVFINKTSIADPSNTFFSWDFGDGTNSTAISSNHQYNTTGNYIVKLKATDGNGCFTVKSTEVIIKTSPLPFNVYYTPGSNVFCDRDSVLLKASASQALIDPFAVYNWYLSPNKKVASGDTYMAKQQGTYLLESVLTNGCKDTSYVFVKVNPLPTTPTIVIGTGYANVFCQNDSTMLQANTTGAVSRYIWYTNANPSPIAINGSNAQIYFPKSPSGITNSIVTVNYLVKVIDFSGCTSDFSAPISISTKPSPTALITAGTSPTTFCEGDSVQIFLAAPVSSNIHEWYKDNLTLMNGVTNIIVKSTGNYKIKETNSFACSVFSNQINVVVNKYPNVPSVFPDFPVTEITPSGQVNFCTGSSITIRSSSVSGASYQWYLNNNLMQGYTGVSATVNKAGTYSVNVKVNGCTTQSPSIILGLLPLPNGILEQPAVTTLCDGYDLKLTARNAVTYQWYLESKKIIGATTEIYNAVSPGTYKVEFFTDKGCSSMSTNSILVKLIEKPTAAFTYDLYCVKTASKFVNQSLSPNSGTVDYLWKFQDGTTSNSIDVVHTFPTSGNYSVKLTVTPTACPQLSNSIIANIKVESPLPPIKYTSINALVGKPISLVARSFGDFYEWKPSNGFNSPFIRLPILTPTTEQLYTVKITDRAGCVTVDSQLVRIFDEQDVFIAGGFTPNSDGKNDKIYPMLVGISSFNYLKIFNRWGNLVFQTDSTDPDKGWDGRYQGKDQPADTYTYVLEATGNNGRMIRKSGSIILIR